MLPLAVDQAALLCIWSSTWEYQIPWNAIFRDICNMLCVYTKHGSMGMDVRNVLLNELKLVSEQ